MINKKLLLSLVLPCLSWSLFTVSSSHAATDIVGTYGIARLVAGFPNTSETMVLAGRGSITFNSGGSCSASLIDTEYGLVGGVITDHPDTQTVPCTYSANSDGVMTFTFEGDTFSYQGQISADGSSFQFAGPDSATQSKVTMLAGNKLGTGMSASSLFGTYGISRMVAGFPSGTEAMVLAGTGTFTFDGTGGCTASLTDTEYRLGLATGVITAAPDTSALTCSYSVENNGGVSIIFPGDSFSYKGSVGADGSSFNLAGPDSDTEKVVMMVVGNKLGAAMSAASLKGTYAIARMVSGFPSSDESMVLAGSGAITFNGVGSCSAALTDTEFGRVRTTGAITPYPDMPALTCSYSVNSNGGVTVTFADDTESYQGTVSADGSSFSLGGHDAGATNKVMVLVGDQVNGRYFAEDLAGTWYGAGIKTPIKNTGDPRDFGYDVDQTMLNADGSGSNTPLSTSDDSTPESFPAASITIGSDGTILTGDPNDYLFMNAGKDVMYQFRIDPSQGEEQLFVELKRGGSYTSADLAGTWYGAGIKTPIKGTSDSANFGYDVDRLTLNADGSGSNTSLSTSDSFGTETFPAGTVTIDAEGKISFAGSSDYFYLSAGKDVMFQFRIDPVVGEQQLFVNVKQGTGYTIADLAGTWYGAGLKTPIKGTSNNTDFGYDVDKNIFKVDGSGTVTTISTSDPSPPESFPAGSFTIASDGSLPTGDSSDFVFMNAGKDVIFHFRVDPGSGEQQLFISLKKAEAKTTGSCGTANGATLPVMPVGNLCMAGTASQVSGSGPWNWTCTGTGGTLVDACIALKGKAGDGDADGSVTIAEVRSAINMFLGIEPCRGSVDSDASNSVSMSEMQKVINAFLGF